MTQGAIRRSHKRYIGWDILQIVNRSDYIAHSILRLFKDVLEKLSKGKCLLVVSRTKQGKIILIKHVEDWNARTNFARECSTREQEPKTTTDEQEAL